MEVMMESTGLIYLLEQVKILKDGRNTTGSMLMLIFTTDGP